MTIVDIQKKCLVDNDSLFDFKEAHPKQIILREIPLPIWKIEYSYLTQRNNLKNGIKYMVLQEDGWDSIESKFTLYIEEQNRKFPEKRVLNVEILNTCFLGYGYLPIE